MYGKAIQGLFTYREKTTIGRKGYVKHNAVQKKYKMHCDQSKDELFKLALIVAEEMRAAPMGFPIGSQHVSPVILTILKCGERNEMHSHSELALRLPQIIHEAEKHRVASSCL